MAEKYKDKKNKDRSLLNAQKAPIFGDILFINENYFYCTFPWMNGLFSYDVQKQEFKEIAVFPEEELYGKDLVLGLERQDDLILITPRTMKHMWVYDHRAEKLEKIHIYDNGVEMTLGDLNTDFYLIKQENGWWLCGRKLLILIHLNLEELSGKVEIREDREIDVFHLFFDYNRINFLQKKEIIEFESASQKISYIEQTDSENYYVTGAYVDNIRWFYHKGEFVKYGEDNEIGEAIKVPELYEENIPFIVSGDEYLALFPHKGNVYMLFYYKTKRWIIKKREQIDDGSIYSYYVHPIKSCYMEVKNVAVYNKDWAKVSFSLINAEKGIYKEIVIDSFWVLQKYEKYIKTQANETQNFIIEDNILSLDFFLKNL